MSEFEPAPDQHRGRPAPRLRALPAPGEQERTPPCSLEAEQHVLAVCLVDDGPTLARCLREKISADSFFFPANAIIYQALVDMHKRGRGISLEILAEELKQTQQLEAVGGFPYLMEVTGEVPTTTHAGYFIEKVRELWILRKLIVLGSEMVEKIYGYTGGLEDFTSRYSLRLQRVADFVSRLNRPGQAEEAEAARKQLDEILAGKVDKSRQLSLGTPYTDQVLLQLDVKNEDWLVVVAGAPSGGKSSLMRQGVGANCNNGKRCAVFLLETGKRRWQWALAASLAGVNLREVLEEPARVMPDRMKLFREWDEAITSWMGERLTIHDDMFFIEDIERTIRELDRTLRERDLAKGVPADKARGLDFVVIDYLQLLATREKIMKREEYVSHLSRNCKRLFKNLNITGIVGAQLNRRARDEERRPRLSDLRESGAIEQDADCVLAVHTPSTDKNGNTQDGEVSVHEVELIQLKRRNGPANVAVDLLFFKSQTRFQDAPRKGDPRPGAPMPKDGYKREAKG